MTKNKAHIGAVYNGDYNHMIENVKNNWASYRVYLALKKSGRVPNVPYTEFLETHDNVVNPRRWPEYTGRDVEAIDSTIAQSGTMFDKQLANGRVLMAPNPEFTISDALELAQPNSPFEISFKKENGPITIADIPAVLNKIQNTEAQTGRALVNEVKEASQALPGEDNTVNGVGVFADTSLSNYARNDAVSPVDYVRDGGVAIGLFSNTVASAVKREFSRNGLQNPSREDSRKAFTNTVRNRFAKLRTVMSQYQDLKHPELAQARQQQASDGATDEMTRDDYLQQIDDSIGKFMTKSEIANMHARLSNVEFPADSLEMGGKMLQHLYDMGQNFTVAVDDSNSETVSALIKGSTNTRVRILDKDPHWVGDVMQSSVGSLSYSKIRGESAKPDNPFALIDYALGKEPGFLSTNPRGKTVRVNLNVSDVDTSRHLVVNNRVNPSQLRQFLDADAAETALRNRIETAKTVLYGELTSEYKIDNELADDDLPADVAESITNKVAQTIGDYDTGFNPVAVIDAISRSDGRNVNNEVVEALRWTNYDPEKLYVDGAQYHQNDDTLEADVDSEDESAVKDENDLDKDLVEDTETASVGDNFVLNSVKNHLIAADKDTMTYKTETGRTGELSPFQEMVLDHARDYLKSMGIRGQHGDTKTYNGLVAGIDDNGVIAWQGYRQRRLSSDEKKELTAQNPNDKTKTTWERIYGSIGQVFEPDEHGIVHTKYASGDNYAMVPGYRGYYQYDHIEKDAKDRLRVRGYNQAVLDKVSESLRQQVVRPITPGMPDVTTGMDTNSLNTLYHGDVYGQRIPENWYEESPLSTETKDAIVTTLSNRVRFDNKLGEFATTFSQSLGPNADASELGISGLVDHKNLRELDDSLDGIFDATMTATGKSQGLVRYLVDGTSVDEEGVITPSDEKDPKANLLKLDYFKHFGKNAWDRKQMASNQLMDAEGVHENARVALMNAGGWTYEDGAMVSSSFAHNNQVVGHDGKLRDLMIGDKISDFGGNKATISMVVDTEMSDKEAKDRNLENEVKLMRDNELDVVMSAYSVLTRDNAGVVAELQDSDDIRDVKSPLTGETVAQSGTLNMIITNMKVDEKTHAYSQADMAEGRGRKFSSQLGWATTQMGAEGLMRDAFAHNDGAWADFREYLVTTGYDMGADGKLAKGYHPQADEIRNEFKVDDSLSADEFLQKLGSEGGMLKLPFEITMVSGETTDELPILSSSLRRETELVDGKVQEHDYTKAYADIYNDLLEYDQALNGDTPANAENNYAKPKSPEELQSRVQKSATELQNRIVYDKLGGFAGENSKHSHLRTKIMTTRVSNSATAVITPDPRMPLDTVVVGGDVYDTIFEGIKHPDGMRASMHRDPVLRDGAVRGVKVVRDDTEMVTGVQMNPAIAASFDGDFDGDSVGLWVPKSKAAQEDLRTVAAVENNLIEPSSEPEAPKPYINTGMDIVGGATAAGLIKLDPDDKEKTAGSVVKDKLSNYLATLDNKHAYKAVDGFVRESLANAWGTDGIMLGTPDEAPEARNQHVYDSLQAMVDKGAKGNPNSVKEYAKYHEGKATRKMDNDIQVASGIKSDDTGVAGANSQKLMALMRDINPEAALEFTYVISQGTLQIKHDAEKARVVDEALNSKLKNLFNGKPIGSTSSKDVLTKKGFKDSIREVYNNELGVDVKEDHLDAVTDVLADGSNTIKPLKSLMQKKASPMDQIAYGGGLQAIDKLAEDGRSLAEGKWSSKMAPDSVLAADEESTLVKKDTQNTKLLDSIKESISASIDKVSALPEDGVAKARRMARDDEPELA